MIESTLTLPSAKEGKGYSVKLEDRSKLVLRSEDGAYLVAHLVRNPPAIQETLVWFLGQEDPLEKGQAAQRRDRLPMPVSLGSDGKESACNVGDLGSIPGLGRSPGGGHSNPLQYSCPENPHGQRSLSGLSPRGRRESVSESAAQHVALSQRDIWKVPMDVFPATLLPLV